MAPLQSIRLHFDTIGVHEADDLLFHLQILYDKSQKEYIIAEKNDVYSYVPKVADVTKSEADKYSVLVEYYNDSPSWADSGERQPIKRKMFTLEKTSEYYNIVSVKTV